ncbi:MAG: ribonuclease P protein component [Rhodospirillaceae bacterium]|nr:ribonuclease P protein component [Rhodospirillaceae bacterium]
MTTTAEETTPDSVGSGKVLTIARLPKRSDFLRIAAEKRRWAQTGLVLQVAPVPKDITAKPDTIRVGFTATRKIGSAVVRNRARRRLRAAVCNIMATRARDDLDYVVIARTGTVRQQYATLQQDLVTALDRCNALVCQEDATGR